jgi:hypothetical protein
MTYYLKKQNKTKQIKSNGEGTIVFIGSCEQAQMMLLFL